MRRLASIILILLGLAHLGLLALAVVLLANNASSANLAVLAAYLVLHAAGAAGGLGGGFSMWRAPGTAIPLLSALTLVFASLLAAVLVPDNASTYLVLALAGAFCAVTAWRVRQSLVPR